MHKSEIAKTASVGYLASDALVNPGYLNSAGKQSPFWDLMVKSGGIYILMAINIRPVGSAAVLSLKVTATHRLFYAYAPDGLRSLYSCTFFRTDTLAADYHGVFYGDRDAANAQKNPKVQQVLGMV